MNTQLIIGLAVGFACGATIIPLAFVWVINAANRKNKATNDETVALMRERNEIDYSICAAQLRIAAALENIQASKP